MPRCKKAKMPGRGRRGSKKAAAKADESNPKFALLNSWNDYYINNVVQGLMVECVKCTKWRLVNEYEEQTDVPEFFECSMWSLGDGEMGNCYVPQLRHDLEYTSELYTPGSLVWAKMRGHPSWPAMVEDDPNKFQYCKGPENYPQYHVVFFGDKVSRSWMAVENIRPFSIPSSDEMPSRADLRKAIKDAIQAQKMKKGDRLLTFSFATRYGKKTGHENNDAKSTCTQTLTSKEDYTDGDLVWVERKGCPSFPGMVEKDPAQMRYCKGRDTDADEMPLGELKTAIEDAEEAMNMTKQDRLMKFSSSVRNGKKRHQDKNEGSEIQVRTEDQNVLDHGYSDCSTSIVPKKRRKSKYYVEDSSLQTLHAPENSEERILESGDQELSDSEQQIRGPYAIHKRKRSKFHLKPSKIQQSQSIRNIHTPGSSKQADSDPEIWIIEDHPPREIFHNGNAPQNNDSSKQRDSFAAINNRHRNDEMGVYQENNESSDDDDDREFEENIPEPAPEPAPVPAPAIIVDSVPVPEPDQYELDVERMHEEMLNSNDDEDDNFVLLHRMYGEYVAMLRPISYLQKYINRGIASLN